MRRRRKSQRTTSTLRVELIEGGVPIAIVERYAQLKPLAIVADTSGRFHTLWPVRGCPGTVPESLAPDGWPPLAGLLRDAVPELLKGAGT